MEIKEFNSLVLEKFADEITDVIFQYIENDEELMNHYLDMVSYKNRQTVNSSLGKAIKVRFNISNLDEEGRVKKGTPKSVLIKSEYTKHKLQIK